MATLVACDQCHTVNLSAVNSQYLKSVVAYPTIHVVVIHDSKKLPPLDFDDLSLLDCCVTMQLCRSVGAQCDCECYLFFLLVG